MGIDISKQLLKLVRNIPGKNNIIMMEEEYQVFPPLSLFDGKSMI